MSSPVPPPRRVRSGTAAVAFCLISLAVFLILRQRAADWLPGFAIAFFLGFAVLVLLLVLDLRAMRAADASIRKLTTAADRIASGIYGVQIPAPGQAELRALTDAFNRMSAQISEEETARTSFIASISHELRSPLTAITGWSETLLYDETLPATARDGLQIIANEASRLTALAEELQQFHRMQDRRFSLAMREIDLAEVLESALRFYQELLRRADMELVYLPCETVLPHIQADPDRLRQIFFNLLDNTVRYAKAGGRIVITVSTQEPYVLVQVRDFGPGVPAEQLPHLCEWAYRGNASGKGCGIGLAVCKEIVTQHGGTLELDNAKGGGLLVSIRLPSIR